MRSKKAVYNIVTNLFLQLSAIVYCFILPKIIIDNFGSEINGLVVSVTQFLSYITLLESGFGPVIKSVLYKPIASKNKQEIANILKTAEKFFRKIAIIFILYIVILCILFPFFISPNFNTLFTISLIIIISFSTFAEYFFGITYRLFLQAEQKTYIVSIIQIITYCIGAIIAIISALLGANIIIIELVTAIVFVMRPIIQNIYIKKKYNIQLNTTHGNYSLKQKWDGLAQHIAAVIHKNTDIVILTFFSTLIEVSIYSVYSLVVMGIKKITQSFNDGLDSSFGDMLAKKETKNLQQKFSTYELLYIILATILFSSTILLITPFIEIYTKGVTDTDYVRPLFGYLLTMGGFLWAVRLPYNSLILAAGHFKQTRRGAWVEALVNIIVSVILVFHFGLIGVAIGTIVAMLIRTVEFVYHANKHILNRKIRESVTKILPSIFIVAVTTLFFAFYPISSPNTFLDWLLAAIITFAITSTATIITFSLFYHKTLFPLLKKSLHKFFKTSAPSQH